MDFPIAFDLSWEEQPGETSESSSGSSSGSESATQDWQPPVIRKSSRHSSRAKLCAGTPAYSNASRWRSYVGARAFVFLLIVLGIRWWSSQQSPAIPSLRGSASPEGDEEQQQVIPLSGAKFLQPGSVYQNKKMSLWSAKGSPISVILRVQEDGHFELAVERLDSINGGDEGWMKLRGSFHVLSIPGRPGIGHLEPMTVAGPDSFLYDSEVLDTATSFVFSCLQRFSEKLVKALDLEVDMQQDSVLVTPVLSAVRMLWDEAVVLHRTSEDKLWNSAGSSDSPPASSP